jgi:hypothetical protein
MLQPRPMRQIAIFRRQFHQIRTGFSSQTPYVSGMYPATLVLLNPLIKMGGVGFLLHLSVNNPPYGWWTGYLRGSTCSPRELCSFPSYIWQHGDS